jgi:hypothetical protein
MDLGYGGGFDAMPIGELPQFIRTCVVPDFSD